MSRERRKVVWSFDAEKIHVRAGQFVSDARREMEEVKRVTLREARADAASVSAGIDFAVGRASIKALPPDSEDLFVAQLEYIGEIDYSVSGGAERVIKLRQRGALPRGVAAAVGNKEGLRWEIALAPELPLRLQLRSGFGQADIDLSRLNVAELALETGVGALNLQLPAGAEPIAASITGGVGTMAISLPADAAGALKIQGGVGECGISVAPGTALRLQAKTGLGQMKLPAWLKAQGKRKSGLFGGGGAWQTEAFDEAERGISIDYTGGIGSFTLGCAEAAK